MGLKRETLERQIAAAESQLKAFEKAIAGDDTKAQGKKNPKWRELNATHRDLKRRLTAVAAVESRESDAHARKAEQQAAAAE